MQTAVIEVPVELKPAVENLIGACQRARSRLQHNQQLDCMVLEQELRDAAQACEREALALVVQAADVDAARIRVDGKVLFRVGRFETTYCSSSGPIAVTRTLYREIRNGPTFDPVAMKLGLVDNRWLPSAASQMSFLVAQGTSREAAETARQLGRLPYSRSSFERVAHKVGGLFVTKHADIEQELIEKFELPEGAAGLVASLDRVAVPCEEPLPGAAAHTRRNIRRASTSEVKRQPKAKRPRRVQRNFRMAYCASVTIVDQHGDALHTIRYGRMPQGDAVDLAEGVASDVFTLREHGHARSIDLPLTIVQDGAPELWNLLDAQFDEHTLGTAPYRLIDMFHLLEKLGEAAKALYGERASHAVLSRWKLRLLNSRTAAAAILAELRDTDADASCVRDAITYIENNADRMDYATARRQGRPLGSGNVEATCKSLVAQRMKRAGSRWKQDTGEHIIQLRALSLSHRWDPALRLTLEPLRKTVRRAA